MTDIEEKFKRHYGKSMELTLGDDVFQFKPFDWREIDLLLGMDSENIEKSVQNLKKAVFDMVKNSYPDLPEEAIQQFCADNFVKLTELIMSKYRGEISEERMKMAARLEELRNRRRKSQPQ